MIKQKWTLRSILSGNRMFFLLKRSFQAVCVRVNDALFVEGLLYYLNGYWVGGNDYISDYYRGY